MRHSKLGTRGGSFHAAVQATPALAFQPGIQALLPPDKKRIVSAERATGSVALDEALKKRFPNANRWDYGIGLPSGNGEMVLWLEPHHEASGETETVINKLRWLKHWLQNEAPALNRMPATFIWQVTNSHRNPNDRRRHRSLAEKEGLRLHPGKLNLAQVEG